MYELMTYIHRVYWNVDAYEAEEWAFKLHWILSDLWSTIYGSDAPNIFMKGV